MLSNEELKKRLLDMLEEDKEFRHAVAGAIGYKEILDRIARVEEEMNKRFLELQAEMDKRFLELEERMNNKLLELEEKTNERFANLQAEMNERFAKVEEEIRDLREESNRLRQDMLEGFRRHDEELKRHWESIEKLRQDMLEGFRRHDEEMAKLRQDMNKRFERMDIKISAIGARWGIMNEQSVREALKGIVGEELGYTVSEWNAYDDEGYVYGYPSNIQLDIVVSNGNIIAVEISSHVKRSDPFTLKKKVELYRKKEGKSVSKIMFVTPFIDDDAIVACNRLGIEVYTA
ncbi:MAG: PD-(D/E)XK nuclease family protein [Candidatus Nitrosocaldus sp.]